MRQILILLLIMPCCVLAQGEDASEPAYYFDISSGNSLKIQDLKEGSLNILYNDRYGKDKEISLSLVNAKNQIIARYELSKSFGLNHFRINIGGIFDQWKENQVYACRMKDEMGNKYELLVRKNTSVTEEPKVSIFVNPLAVHCDGYEENVVDFYGTIEGGKAPYTVSWYVLNNVQSDFLYQPREEKIERPGRTMIINVDKKPDYFVMVLVTDACNKEARQMVHLTCQTKKDKIHTVFVEPLKKMPESKPLKPIN